MNEKIRWLRGKLASSNLDGMIVSNPINIKYLTNISAEGILIINRKENLFITDGRYMELVNSVLTITDEIIAIDAKNLCKEDFENLFLFCENVGFEENYVTYSKYKYIMHTYKINNLVETENIFEKARTIKDDEEIEKIKKACEITDNCFLYIQKFIKKGMTEKAIALEMERYMRLNGAEDISFEPIVASGSNSSMPHSVPTDKTIQSGDPIILDFGCKYKGYCSDMTRTIFIDYVKESIKPVYNLVLKNQKLTLKEMKENASIKYLSKSVESDYKQNGYELIHSLGHGVGLEIHELPNINSKSEIVLKENMIVTNEPGIYLPGNFGIRIEDTVLVTKNGGIALTNSNKEFVII